MAPLAWVPRPTLRIVGGLFWLLTGNTSFAPNPSVRDALRGVPLLASYFALCFVALVCAVKVWRTSGRSFQTWRLGLLFSWLFVPIALTVAGSFLKPVFVSKYLIVCMPPITLLAAIGIQSIKRRWTRAAAVVAVVCMAVVALPHYYQFRSRNHEWRAATDYILSQARPGDAFIFFVAPGRLLFDYYHGTSGGSATDIDVVYPEFRDENENPKVLVYLPRVRSDLLDYVASHNRRVWLVLFHDEYAFTSGVSHQLQESLASKYRKVQENRFEGYHERVALLLYAYNSIDQQVHSGVLSH